MWSVTVVVLTIMARFRITTKHVKNSNGIRIEPEMSVEVVPQSMSNPDTTCGEAKFTGSNKLKYTISTLVQEGECMSDNVYSFETKTLTLK